MNKQNNELKVGLVSIIGLAILIVGLVLGQGFNFSGTSNLVKIRFDNAGGIKVSAPVVINGVKRGSVASVESNNGGVLISVVLDKTDDLKEDASAKITILEITGGKKIEINPGVSTNKFSLSGEMKGKNTADIGDMVAMVSDVSGDLINLVRRMDSISVNLNKFFANDTLFSNIDKSVAQLTAISTDANRLLSSNYSNLDRSLKDISSITKDLKEAIRNNSGNVDTLFSELKLTIKEARGLMKNVDGTVNSANLLITDINGITKDIKSNGGAVNKLLYDKEFALKMDTAFMKITELVDFINKNGVNVNVRLGTRP